MTFAPADINDFKKTTFIATTKSYKIDSITHNGSTRLDTNVKLGLPVEPLILRVVARFNFFWGGRGDCPPSYGPS